ncbi:MAG: cation:proton antiporter [Rhodobiaceae bacterium]|nr:cation:proton antiporter [Rhizobiaceae bacterium]MCB1481670.1 cation:proton antiporter [Rhodobiaceae bacterium]MCC0012659.1 cation:proton antiporter [Rhodobiaceae bacterium]MCC0018034.1 cation:proton antiporter [Rhodobiaceae bacterium]MCC0052315.1 cation:proton antiporter [Rhodobiaceae bacterium]
MEPLFHLAWIWIAVFAANILARKTRLTPVVWFLAMGSLLANTGVLAEPSGNFIPGLAMLGIILIMFALGFEEKTDNFLYSVKKSWGIAFFGAVGPFLAAYAVADYFWNDTSVSLMCGLTMTATAVSLTMVSLQNEGLQNSPAATRIMTSAVLDDIASLALVAILVPIAVGGGSINIVNLVSIAAKAVAFFIIVTALGAWLFPHDVRGWLKRVPFVRTYGMQHLLAFGRHSTLTVLLLALLVGLLAHELGFHPAVGAYMAGLILKEEYFQIQNEKGSFADTKRIIDNVAFSWIGPIFFVELGSHLIFDWSILVSIIPHIIILTVAIFTIQVATAALAARYTGGMDWPSSMLIGFGMLGRAELAFVVMDIAYVQSSILNTEAFYTLMATAFFLNILVPITITLWRPRYVAAMEAAKSPAPGEN